MPTVLVLDRYPVPQERAGAFVALARELVDAMREAEGALWAQVLSSPDLEGGYLVASEWRTPGDLDRFLEGADFASFTEGVDPLLEADSSRRRFVSAD